MFKTYGVVRVLDVSIVVNLNTIVFEERHSAALIHQRDLVLTDLS
ncbi:MAG: hypothetical protein N3E36_06675 [Sulfolobales archaeon]|nr:hypothetical protein [Sulfolobales archaeon]